MTIRYTIMKAIWGVRFKFFEKHTRLLSCWGLGGLLVWWFLWVARPQNLKTLMSIYWWPLGLEHQLEYIIVSKNGMRSSTTHEEGHTKRSSSIMTKHSSPQHSPSIQCHTYFFKNISSCDECHLQCTNNYTFSIPSNFLIQKMNFGQVVVLMFYEFR